MAKQEDSIYLEHILDAIKKVERYTASLGFDRFVDNDLVVDGVCREIEIICEASARLSSEFREQYATLPWSDIIGMRNMLIHGYGAVDLKIVWETVQNNLPELKVEIQKILNK